MEYKVYVTRTILYWQKSIKIHNRNEIVILIVPVVQWSQLIGKYWQCWAVTLGDYYIGLYGLIRIYVLETIHENRGIKTVGVTNAAIFFTTRKSPQEKTRKQISPVTLRQVDTVIGGVADDAPVICRSRTGVKR